MLLLLEYAHGAQTLAQGRSRFVERALTIGVGKDQSKKVS